MTDPFGPPPGAAAPVDPPTAPRTHRALIAVVAVAALVIGLAAGGAAVAAYDHRDDLATTVSTAGLPGSGTLDSGALEPGVCFAEREADKDTDTVGDVDAQKCTDPHQYQVFATLNLDDGAYPGDGEVSDLAAERCTKAWVANADLKKVTDIDQLHWFTPTEDSWDEDHDRYVVCFVSGPAAPLTAPLPIASS